MLYTIGRTSEEDLYKCRGYKGIESIVGVTTEDIPIWCF